MRQIIILILVIVFISSFGVPQDAKFQNLNSSNTLVEENHYLKQQIDELKRTESTFINIVIWTLGTALVIVLAVIGFLSYVNYKSMEKEKEEIRRGLVSEIKNEIDIQQKQLVKSIDQINEKNFKIVLKDSQKRFDYLKKGILLTMLVNIRKSFNQAMTKKSFADAFLHISVILTFSIDIKDDNKINDALESINDLLSNNFKPKVEDVSKLLGALDKIDEKYKIEKESIIEKIKQKRQ